MVTFVVLSIYGTMRRQRNELRFAQALAVAVVIALVVNVVTI